MLLTSSVVSAGVVTWTGPNTGTSPWNHGAYWSTTNVPSPEDDVVLNVSGTYTITVDSPDVTINSLTLGASGGGNTLTLNSGMFTIKSDCINDLSTGTALCWDRTDSETFRTWTSAGTYCADKGARLPTIEELVLFATKGNFVFLTNGCIHEGICSDFRPWLTDRGYLYTGNAVYWSSTPALGGFPSYA